MCGSWQELAVYGYKIHTSFSTKTTKCISNYQPFLLSPAVKVALFGAELFLSHARGRDRSLDLGGGCYTGSGNELVEDAAPTDDGAGVNPLPRDLLVFVGLIS